MARALTDLKLPSPAAAQGSRSGGRRWGDLRTRVISAAVLTPLALFCLWQGGWPWRVLVGLAAIGMADEWRRLCRHRPFAAGGQFAAGALYIVPGCSAQITASP